MSKREIKADKVSIEGDFIKVETKSTRGSGAIAGGIIGTLLGGPGAGSVLGGLLGAAAGQDGGTKLIPKERVAEITQDSGGIKVIVDEDRGKGRR